MTSTILALPCCFSQLEQRPPGSSFSDRSAILTDFTRRGALFDGETKSKQLSAGSFELVRDKPNNCLATSETFFKGDAIRKLRRVEQLASDANTFLAEAAAKAVGVFDGVKSLRGV